MGNKTFKVITLGCRVNQYEAQAYRDQLLSIGCIPADNDQEADICIVNTCTVTSSAASKSRYQIRHIIRQNPNAEVYITGCLSDDDPEGIRSIEGVTGVISNSEKEHLLSTVFPDDIKLPEFAIKNFAGRTRAFIKIQDGCNSFCSYCIIPYVRGRSRSRKVKDILHEIKNLIEKGYREIVLTGINVGDFEDDEYRLADLVGMIDDLSGIERLRISSLDPNDIDDELIKVICNGKHTCHSLHLVLQSGSNNVLKRMNRKYNRHNFLEVVNKFRSIDPDFGFSTDIIVGFPGETEQDFEDSLAVVREVLFSKVHMFPFSPREGTVAYKFENAISFDVIKDRKQYLSEVSNKCEHEWRERFVGRVVSVLTENRDMEDEKLIWGHTDQFVSVVLKDPSIDANVILEVKVLENNSSCLVGVRDEN